MGPVIHELAGFPGVFRFIIVLHDEVQHVSRGKHLLQAAGTFRIQMVLKYIEAAHKLANHYFLYATARASLLLLVWSYMYVCMYVCMYVYMRLYINMTL